MAESHIYPSPMVTPWKKYSKPAFALQRQPIFVDLQKKRYVSVIIKIIGS